MRRLAAVSVVIVGIAAALWFAQPAARHPFVVLSLLRADVPQHLPVPVRGVRARDVRDSWGGARPGGRRHQGIDIFAKRNTEVLSATPGIVVTVGTNRLGGRIVRVLGPGGLWHYYAHLERHGPIEAGDVVGEGAVLGYVGDSGDARGTPTHLHYGIYGFRGEAVNPYPFLRPSAR